MRFLVDNQLPLQLAAHIRRRGHECTHVIDIGLDEASDAEVWNRASSEGLVLISKDEDFVNYVNRPGDAGRLVWVRLGNCRNAALCEAFDRVLSELIQALSSGQQMIEVR